MKDRKRLAVGLAMGLIMAVVIARAEALDIPFNGTFSGSTLVANTEIDTNGDGVKATWGTAGAILGDGTNSGFRLLTGGHF